MTIQKKILISTVVIVAVVIVTLGGVFAYQYFAPKNTQEKTNISSLVYSADKKYSAFMETIKEPNLVTSKIHVKNLQTNEDKIVKTESCCIDGVGCGLCPLPCQIKNFSPNNKYVVIDCGTSPARTVEVVNIDTKKEISFSSAVNYIWSSNEEITFYEPRESDETPSPECKINVVSGVKDCDTQTAGWQTYTNAEYGFEIKYPGDFQSKIREKGEMGAYSLVSVDIDKNSSDNVYAPVFMRIVAENENFVLGTRDWKSFELGEIKGDIAYSGGGCEIVFVSSQGQRFYISTKNNPETDSITNQMLSTFKFTK